MFVVTGEADMSDSQKPKKPEKFYDLKYKRKIVQEYLSGTSSAKHIVEREGLERGQIYNWRVQLIEHVRGERRP
jgi:transposase-like protein